MISKVSVIIPVYNKEKYIKRCLESVLNQTYSNLEIVIIDDASTDNSMNIVNGIEDERIKIISLSENRGVSIARNKGIEIATGKYICFLDADDYWILDKIEKQVKMIELNNYVFVYGGYEYLKNERKHIAHVPTFLDYNKALKNTAIFTSTVMLNMNILSKEDIYMPNVKSEDTATWWKILKKGITAYGIDEAIAVYRVGEKSLSSNKITALKRTWNLYKMEDINYAKKVYYFLCYVKNAIKRRI